MRRARKHGGHRLAGPGYLFHEERAPRPDDLVLHACGGWPRFWTAPDSHLVCTGCAAPVVPEQPHRLGHARVRCPDCGWVGICPRAATDAAIAELAAQGAPA